MNFFIYESLLIPGKPYGIEDVDQCCSDSEFALRILVSMRKVSNVFFVLKLKIEIQDCCEPVPDIDNIRALKKYMK